MTLIASAAGVLLLPCVLLVGVWPWPFADYVELGTIHVDEAYAIRLKADAMWDAAQAVYFEVNRNGTPLQPYRTLGYTQGRARSLRFDLLTTPDNQFFAVVEHASPDVVMMFYDKESGVLWPGGNDGPPWDEHYRRRNELLDKLRSQYPKRKLILSHEVREHRLWHIGG